MNHRATVASIAHVEMNGKATVDSALMGAIPDGMPHKATGTGATVHRGRIIDRSSSLAWRRVQALMPIFE